MDVDLVIVDAERDDVARRLRVAANVEVVLERLQGDATFASRRKEVGLRFAYGIATMAKGTGRPGDVPAAPAVRIRGIGFNVGDIGSAQGFAFGVGHDGAGPQARRPFIALVAGEALVVALKQRLGFVLLGVQEVEGRPEDGVEERDFHGAARHPADIGFVREVEDAWVLRANERALLTGLAENEDLRVEGYIELFE